MLEHYVVTHPDLKPQIIEKLSDSNPTFVFSDLQTKLWAQNLLCHFKQGIVCTDQVLRASELWQKLLLRVDPAWSHLPKDIAFYVFEKKMDAVLRQDSLNISVKDSRRMYQMVGQVLPLLSHEEGRVMLESWFADHDEAQQRWGHWYQMAAQIWADLKDSRSLPQEWMKAVLLNESLETLPNESFVFDLDLDLDDVESELIINLSRLTDVKVLIPSHYITKPCYQNLIDLSQAGMMDTVVTKSNPQLSFLKLPSQLAEIKQATAQIRIWLDQGLAAEQIAVISPRMEIYWPTLCEYLRIEGIPFAKDRTVPLSQIPAFHVWLSQVRVSIDAMESVDVEQFLFLDCDEPHLEHKKFQERYRHIYNKTDLQRGEGITHLLPSPKNPDELISIHDFLSWSLELISHKEKQVVMDIYPDLDDVASAHLRLSYAQWLSFFEKYVAHNEKTLNPSMPAGVALLSISQSVGRPFKKIFFLGLDEKSLIEHQDTPLLWKDVESLRFQFGFNLPHPDRGLSSDRMSWLVLKKADEMVFSYAETDFSGKFQAPSFFWLQGALDKGHSLELQSPSLTRWDEIMAQDMGLRTVPQPMLQRLLYDKSESGWEPKVIYPQMSLSASKFEEFHKCPFRFYATVGLGLRSSSYLDIDLDAMARGTLLHKICEVIVAEDIKTVDHQELDHLVDRCRDQAEKEVYSEEVWAFLKPQYVDKAKNFIRHEQQWNKIYPQTQTHAQEQEVKSHVGSRLGRIYFGQDAKTPFRGKIDRIDRNQQSQLFIIDYKSSGASLHQYGSWLEKGHLQLLIYSLALMDGALGEPQEVVGAGYYVLHDMDRKKSLVHPSVDPQYLPPGKIKEEGFERLFEQARDELGAIYDQMSEGRIEPKPRDKKICENCDWNQLCRYPELSQ
jgi:ATP-dependent helicase/nuclease subunit B